MSPKAKNKSFPPVKVTERLLEETIKCAELIGKDGVKLSEYIRQAVEEKNERVIKSTSIVYATSTVQHESFTTSPVDSTHKNNTVSKPSLAEQYGKSCEAVAELQRQGKLPKSTMVNPLTKGGNKK